MKKKILCTIIMASLILSMTACGSTDTADTASTEEVSVSAESSDEASADNGEEAETESNAETEAETEVETEAPIEVQAITYCSFFKNGYAYLSCEDGNAYIFNAKDNTVMLKDNDEWGGSSIFSFGDYILLPGNTSYVVDPKADEVKFKSGDDGLYIHAWDTEAQKLVITKKEESFDGNKFYVGVMNNKLEWDYELTEITSDALSGDKLAACTYLLFGDKLLITNFSKNLMVYSLKDKTLTDMSDDFNPGFCTSTDKGKHICYAKNRTDLMGFGSDGEIKKICETNDNALFNIISNTIVINYRDDWSFYDLDFNKLGFDLSSYDVENIVDVNSDFIAFEAKNPDGAAYTIIMDKNNKLIGEPIKSANYGVVLTDDYAILIGMNMIVNLKTGETKEVAYNIQYVDNATGKMMVESSDDYDIYLVDPAEPDTLINPLEIAK